MTWWRKISNRPQTRPASLASAAGSCPDVDPEAVTARRTRSGRTPSPDQRLPALDTTGGWLNSLYVDVRGKVVLYQLWTYGCSNCTNTIPYLRALWLRYAPHGLMIVGIHTPEFAREGDPGNVATAVEHLGVTWPVLLDPDHTNWRAFGNRFWPRTILADAVGRPVFDHAGEGAYDEMEDAIRHMLKIHPAATRASYPLAVFR